MNPLTHIVKKEKELELEKEICKQTQDIEKARNKLYVVSEDGRTGYLYHADIQDPFPSLAGHVEVCNGICTDFSGKLEGGVCIIHMLMCSY